MDKCDILDMKIDNMKAVLGKEQKIYLGSSVQIDLTLIDSVTRQPVDFTGWTELTAIFPAAPSGQFNITASSGNPVASGQITFPNGVQAGKIRIVALPSQSSAFLETDEGSIEILVDKGPNFRKVIQIIDRVPFVARIYS